MTLEKTLTLVTSKQQKAREAAAVLGIDIVHVDFTIVEIQSMYLREVVQWKAASAFSIAGIPVLVDDVSLHLAALGGFPGPFVRFWADTEVGGPGYQHAVRICEAMHQHAARAVCGAGYYDGSRFIYAEGEVCGNFQEPYGQSGFGFDPYFFPYDREGSFASMGEAAKNTCSHRFLAFSAMRMLLQNEGVL